MLPVAFTATWLRRVAGVAVAAGVVLIGVLVTFIPDQQVRRGDPDLAGWLAIVFGALTGTGFVVRLFRPASLTLTANGFLDDTSQTSAGFVPWSAVDDIAVDPRGRMVAVRLSDTTVLQPLRHPIRRWLRRANTAFGAHVYIPGIVLSTSVEEIAHAMRLARIQSLYGSDS